MPTIPLTPFNIAATLIVIGVAVLFLSIALSPLFTRKPSDNGLNWEDGRKIRRQ